MDSHTLQQAALEIFFEALQSVDAGRAVRRAVRLNNSQLQIVNTTFNLEQRTSSIYAIALGKAARPMAQALSEILGERLAGLVASVGGEVESASEGEGGLNASTPDCWQVFAGGHPLPNEESLRAAKAAFQLLRRAEAERALVIFLISGGGSAMMEWPRDRAITLEELRRTNRLLVSCGAQIEEINSVRRALSAVKGGGLSALAPSCDQVSLIISDTNAGAEATVASGPTFDPPMDTPDPLAVIARYELAASLPLPVQRAVKQFAQSRVRLKVSARREHQVLLDNLSAIEAARMAARARGFAVEVARDIIEQPIAEGCAMLLARLFDARNRAGDNAGGVCLVSGGEFACPVRGRGLGGRNAESALRWAIELDALAQAGSLNFQTLALSAGTDGIDGNSPASGAFADETSLARARALKLDARRSLAESDAYSFFQSLGDAILTGPTGTNVRDLRILLAV